MFSGSMAPLGNLMAQVANQGLIYNCTMVRSSSVGTYDYATGKYSGCLDLLERNESQVLFGVAEYPMKNLEVIDPFQVLFDEKLQFLISYNASEHYVPNDVVKSFSNTFSVRVWITIILVGIIGAGFFSLTSKLLTKYELNQKMMIRGKQDAKYSVSDDDLLSESTAPLYESFSHLIHCQSTHYKRFSRRMVSISLTLGGFFLIQHLLREMSVGLVVAKKPFVFNSYDDLLEAMKRKQPIVPSFIDSRLDYYEFKYARQDCIQGQMWQKLRELQTQNHSIFIDIGKSLRIKKVIVEGLRKQQILIVSGILMDVVKKMICGVRADSSYFSPHLYFWKASDPRSLSTQGGLLKRKDFHSHPVSANMEKYSKRLFEASTVSFLKKEIAKGVVSVNNADAFRDCLTDSLRIPQVSLANFSIKHFGAIYVLFSGAIRTALIVLLLEIIVGKLHKIVRKQKKSRSWKLGRFKKPTRR